MILVTGGTGYIGSHTCVALAQAGHDIVILDNLSNSRVSVIDRLETLCGKRPRFIHGDIHGSANTSIGTLKRFARALTWRRLSLRFPESTEDTSD